MYIIIIVHVKKHLRQRQTHDKNSFLEQVQAHETCGSSNKFSEVQSFFHELSEAKFKEEKRLTIKIKQNFTRSDKRVPES